MSDAFAFDPGRGGGGGGGDGVPQRHPAGRSCPIILVALPVLIPAALLRLALRRAPRQPAERATCRYCGKPNVVVDRSTGWLMPHYPKGHKGPKQGNYCLGSQRHRDSSPAGAA